MASRNDRIADAVTEALPKLADLVVELRAYEHNVAEQIAERVEEAVAPIVAARNSTPGHGGRRHYLKQRCKCGHLREDHTPDVEGEPCTGTAAPAGIADILPRDCPCQGFEPANG